MSHPTFVHHRRTLKLLLSHPAPLGVRGGQEGTSRILGTDVFVQEMRPLVVPDSKHSKSGSQDFLG